MKKHKPLQYSLKELDRRENIQILITIIQVCAFIYTVYFVIDWHIGVWEGMGMKSNDMPIESTCVVSLVVGIIVVRILEIFKPVNILKHFDKDTNMWIQFDRYEDMCEYFDSRRKF